MTNSPVSPDRLLRLRPRAPLIVRDGRPFSADPGARAESLEWPLPQTIAGALRTVIGDNLNLDWRNGGADIARAITVHGPLLVAQRSADQAWQVYLPAPRDALVSGASAEALQCAALRPGGALRDGAGTDLPQGLQPLTIQTDVKPYAGAAYWSLADQTRWLAQPTSAEPPADWLGPMPREVRVHVSVDHARRAANEGALFSTSGLAFPDAPPSLGPRRSLSSHQPEPAALAMLCRIRSAPAAWTPGAGFAPMGGERRLTAVEIASEGEWPNIPPALESAVAGASRLRLQLATPALFPEGGWRPDWLDPLTLQGAPPGLPDLTLQLVGAAAGRRIPVSGWDLEKRGPKAVRYAVPSGSVYFFEVVGARPTPAQAAGLWLQSIVPNAQDQRDGFGLAVPGVW